MKSMSTPAGRRSPIGVAGRVVLVAAVAAAAVTGLGVGAAAAGGTADETFTVEAFRETVKPWDSIHIPSLSCPRGYLANEELSPGRIVPKGVQVIEPGGVGVTIAEAKGVTTTDWWNRTYHVTTGTDADRGPSSATNWDPFTSHELVINLRCTTDLTKAAKNPRMG